ncbi:C1 family peptidase, partial [Bdellovibrionota bacterium FG-1]
TPTGDLPADAYSRAGEALPEGFTQFSGSQAEWDKLKTEGNLVPFTDTNNQNASDTAQAQKDHAEGTINAFLLLHPEFKDQIEQLTGPVDTSTRSAQDVNLRLEGGVYLHDVVLKDGKSRTYALLDSNYSRQILAGGLEAFSPNKAAHSTAKVYEHFYDLFSQDPRFKEFESRFKTPADVYKMKDVKSILAEVSQFDVIKQLKPILLDFDPRPTPQNEEGYGTGGDRHTNWCSTLSTQGVMGSSFKFPLKFYTTSVKDQAGRGSCVAFGVNAALESAWARDTGNYINLSEQDLYYHMKGFWWPMGDSYGDGSDQHAIFDQMVSLGGGYYVPFETQWNYNPSLSRTQDPEHCGQPGFPACLRKYTHSCDGYSEFCSDTNHQGRAACIQSNGYNYCGYAGQVDSTAQQVRAKGDAELWDMADKDKSVAWTMIALLLKSPVVVGLSVTPSFDGVDADGYVHYAGTGEKNRGGHALEVVGFIGDSYLPAGAAKAGAAGGGGYFIIKNSWGTCAGDAGYYYIPYQWIKTYAYSMVVLNGISHK